MMKGTIGKNEHYALMSSSEIYSLVVEDELTRKWMVHQTKIQAGNGARSIPEFTRMAEVGDETLVPRADAMLHQIEDQIPVSLGWRNVDDVVGSVPNIPAFLAGHPQHMRRRERAFRETAPITIAMNLSSGMLISQDAILRRGITLLALVRMLIEHRSVELWVGTVMGDGDTTCAAMWKIDTAPLDLARASFQIADVSMSRSFGYAACESLVDRHIGGFGNENIVQRLKNVVGWHDLLYIPAIRHGDQMTSDPVGWLKRVMRQYTNTGDDE